VILKVRCPANANGGHCADAVALYTPTGKLPATVTAVKRRKATLLGSSHFSVPAGNTLTAHFHLNHAGVKLASTHTSFRARLILTSRDLSHSNTRRYTVTIKRAPGHRRKRR
jgi:hypothetical protein